MRFALHRSGLADSDDVSSNLTAAEVTTDPSSPASEPHRTAEVTAVNNTITIDGDTTAAVALSVEDVVRRFDALAPRSAQSERLCAAVRSLSLDGAAFAAFESPRECAAAIAAAMGEPPLAGVPLARAAALMRALRDEATPATSRCVDGDRANQAVGGDQAVEGDEGASGDNAGDGPLRPLDDAFSPLHRAAMAGDHRLSALLSEASADDVNAAAADGVTTPLVLACRNGHARVARSLLRAGADPVVAHAGDVEQPEVVE